MIQPIVEGHGEVPAVPILLRKLAGLMEIPFVQVGSPIRRPKSALLKEGELKRAVTLARRQDQPRLTAHADWSSVHQRSRSFRKMAKEARRLFVALGLRPSAWPN